MRKFISVLFLMVFTIACAMAESTDPAAFETTSTDIIGGADGPTEIHVTDCLASSDDMIQILLDECAVQLHELSGDQVLLDAMTTSEEIRQIVATFHEDSGNGIASWNQITDTDLLLATFGEEMDNLSERAQAYLNQRVFNASYLSTVLSSMHGVNMLAATSLLNVCQPLAVDLPTAIYIALLGNDTGMVMGVWNNGDGIVLVTASFVPNISSFEKNNSLARLFR